MLEVYWGFFIGGVLFAVVTVIFGDWLGDALDGILDFLSLDGGDIFNPMVIVGAITVFGATGILLTQYTGAKPLPIAVLAFLLAVFSSLVVYFLYVKPMKQTENSTGFSMQELVGKIGEVITPIPAQGYGEILVRVGAGNTNQIAASFDREHIPAGSRVVVIEVKDYTVFVAPFEEKS